MDYCLVQSGLHEILYIITETGGKSAGYNSKHKPEPIQLKTSSPSSGPSPDTGKLRFVGVEVLYLWLRYYIL